MSGRLLCFLLCIASSLVGCPPFGNPPPALPVVLPPLLPPPTTATANLTPLFAGREIINPINFQYAIDDNGNATVAWLINNGQNTVLQAGYKPVNGPWQLCGQPAQIGVPGTPTLQINCLSPLGFNVLAYQLVMDRLGNAALVWQVLNGTSYVIQASYKPAGRGWFYCSTTPDPTQQIYVLSSITPGIDYTPPSVAIGRGTAVIVWQINAPRHPLLNTVVQAAYTNPTFVSQYQTLNLASPWQSPGSGGPALIPGSPFLQSSALSYFGYNVPAPPAVDVDDITGTAVVAWKVFNNTNYVVQAVLRPLSTPAGLPITAWPAALIPNTQNNILTNILPGYNVAQSSNPQVSIENNNTIVFWRLIQNLTRTTSYNYLQAAYNNGVSWIIPTAPPSLAP